MSEPLNDRAISPGTIPTTASATGNVVLRLPQLIKKTGLSRSSLYSRMADGSFPRGFSLGGRARGWLLSEVERWIVLRAGSR